MPMLVNLFYRMVIWEDFEYFECLGCVGVMVVLCVEMDVGGGVVGQGWWR